MCDLDPADAIVVAWATSWPVSGSSRAGTRRVDLAACDPCSPGTNSAAPATTATPAPATAITISLRPMNALFTHR